MFILFDNIILIKAPFIKQYDPDMSHVTYYVPKDKISTERE